MEKYIYPAPGTHGQYYQMHNLITVYCPLNFEIFQVRINSIMTLNEFKSKIAQKFSTSADNINLYIGEKLYPGDHNEKTLKLSSDLQINEHKVIKITFKDESIIRINKDQSRSKSKYNYSSSVVVTTQNYQNFNFAKTNEKTNEQLDYVNQQLQINQQVETDVRQDTCLMNQFFKYQDQMNNDHPELEQEQVCISFRKIHPVKSKQYSSNIKLMQNLKEPKMKNCFMTQSEQWKATIAKISSHDAQIEVRNSQRKGGKYGSFLNKKNQSIVDENSQQYTTVVVTNKSFENYGALGSQSIEKGNIRVKHSSQYSNQSFYKKSFVEELDYQAAKLYQQTQDHPQKKLEDTVQSQKEDLNMTQVVSKQGQIKYKIRRKQEQLNENVKRKILGSRADKQRSRILQ